MKQLAELAGRARFQLEGLSRRPATLFGYAQTVLALAA